MGIIVDSCPLAAAIPDVPIKPCPESYGQIQKIIFQRVNASAGVKNAFVIATANPNVKASWSALLTADDGTKVVPSPFISAPEMEPGEARNYGGGNETRGGIEIVIGREPTSFTGNLLHTSQETIEALKKYVGEQIGVYMIDEAGTILGLSDNIGTPTKFMPIPIEGLFIGDKKFGGLEAPDMNAIKWKFYPNWSDKLTAIKPTDFDPLNDLVGA